MALSEFIEQKRGQGITITVEYSTKEEFVPSCRRVFFGLVKLKYNFPQTWEEYCVKENGIKTLAAQSLRFRSQYRLYDHGNLIDKPKEDVKAIFDELKALHDAPKIAAEKAERERKAQETARIIEMQKVRVYSYVLTNCESGNNSITLDEVIATKKQKGGTIEIECKPNYAADGSGSMLLRIMENGKPILGVWGCWSNAVAYAYMDGIEWLDDARLCWYVKDKSYEPDDIFVDTCRFVFRDVLALYNVQEKEKKEEKLRQEAANRQQRVNAIYAQWANGGLQSNQRGGAC